MAEVVIVAAPRTAAIAAATAVAADARPRVTAVVQVMVAVVEEDVPLPVTAVEVAVAIRRRAADPRTVAVGRRTVVERRRAEAADMGGDTALDSFPA
jgi:hypothetical protein